MYKKIKRTICPEAPLKENPNPENSILPEVAFKIIMMNNEINAAEGKPTIACK